MTARLPSSIECRCVSFSAGIDKRRNIETALSRAFSGVCPRPSFKWHRWQARALKTSPNPSELFVDTGAVTQSFRNKPLPITKDDRSSNEKLEAGWEKAPRSNRLRFVVVPPKSDSHFPTVRLMSRALRSPPNNAGSSLSSSKLKREAGE